MGEIAVSYLSRTRLLGVLVALAVGSGLAVSSVPASGAVPGDTGLIALVRANQIYTSTTSGTAVRKITSSAKNYRPHWSPDGKRIAYVHESPGGHTDIWVMNANGSNKLRVTRLGDTTEPTWSPDGKWLAFGANGSAFSSFSHRLRKVRSTTPFGRPIVMPASVDSPAEPAVLSTLAWSPDGKKIVFDSTDFPDSPDFYLLVYTIATERVGLRGLVGGSCCGEGYFRDPTWTNDSLFIAMSMLHYEEDEDPPSASHLALIRDPDRAPGTHPNVLGDRDPDYSPTGSKLVFSHWSSIFTSDADGANRTRVTRGYQADWQPVVG